MARISLSGVASERPVAPPAFTPSAQQVAAFDFVRHSQGNAVIEAVAGSGKTSTLIEVCKLIQSGAVFLAFNKKISQEIAAKLAGAGISDRDVKAATFHSVGFQAWARHAPKSVKNVKAEKLDILAEKIGMPKYLRFFAKQLVSLAKQAGIGVAVPEKCTCPSYYTMKEAGPLSDLCPFHGKPEYRGKSSMEDSQPWIDLIEHFDLLDLIPAGDEELDYEEVVSLGLSWSLKLLRSSIAEADSMIDFDDMIYMPLYCNLKLWQYEWVLVDEAQDTNAMRREMARRLLRPGGRLIAVGDRHQAIYGFTGADADALDLISDTFQCQSLPLTVTYRCPQAVVALAQQWVPHIQAREGAPEGIVRHIEARHFNLVGSPVVDNTPKPGDVIICRNTKPLVDLAFSYLKRRIPASIEGRDIGRGLLTLSRKWRSAYSVGDLRLRLEEFLEHEKERLLAQNRLHKFGAVEDKVQTLLVLADTFPDDTPLEEFRRVLESLFADSEPGQPQRKIILSTIHKAKGREWDRVWLYGRNALMPSFYARQEWQLEQEANLAYVAVTRAASELIEVDLPGRRRGSDEPS